MKLLQAPKTSATSVGSLLQRTAVAESSSTSPARLPLRLKPTNFQSLHISSVGRSKLHRLQAAPDGIAPENAEVLNYFHPSLAAM